MCTAELPQGYKLQMDDIFYFILLILFLAFWRRYFLMIIPPGIILVSNYNVGTLQHTAIL